MGVSRKWVGAGVVGLAACLWFTEATPVFAVMSHDAHVAVDSAVDVATPVNTQAGPMLMDKMSKAVEQIERQVQTKGPFQGAGAHAMQQGVLLVAEDQDKVKVTQGARCPAQAPGPRLMTSRRSTLKSRSTGLGISILATCTR